MDVLDIIAQCAGIPSFSTEETCILPCIEDFVKTNSIGEIEYVHMNNLFISVPGKRDMPPVALTAHLDKINHFGSNPPASLPVSIDETRIIGQMDDAVGLGICLSIAALGRTGSFPPLYLLFSEMEERWTDDACDGVSCSGIGAMRLSQYLVATGKIPSLILTVDTTPFYKGTEGVSLYSRFWELCDLNLNGQLPARTEALEKYFLAKFNGIKHQNNTNDYINYGKMFHSLTDRIVPSIAIEPAIYPYHTKGEGVFISDIRKVMEIITTFLSDYPFA